MYGFVGISSSQRHLPKNSATTNGALPPSEVDGGWQGVFLA